MNEPYNKVNVRLLCILSYIGPLFIMGRVAVEKEVPEVDFHSRQGGILFGFVAGAYLITVLLCALLGSFPAVREIVGFLLYVGVTVAWVLMAALGISSAVKKQMKPLPFIGDLDKIFNKK